MRRLRSCKPLSVLLRNFWSHSGLTLCRNFWQYFEPIRLNMPVNCSSDVQAVIAYVDAVFDSGSEVAINDVKERFGMGNGTYVGDVASARMSIVFHVCALLMTC